jgi:heptosyltransferase-1
MPNILLIKTSSMGDVLHNLPVVSDIGKHFPNVNIDWVAEESFATLPTLHPRIRNVIPVAIRRWRKSWWSSRTEIRTTCDSLRDSHYDFALDTQGLFKSALITHCANSPRCGYDWGSAREPIASLFYDRTFSVPKDLHAVERNRRLAGLALGYTPIGIPDYGIQAPPLNLPWLSPTNGCPRSPLPNPDGTTSHSTKPASGQVTGYLPQAGEGTNDSLREFHIQPYVILLHATSRDDKLWNEANWITLGRQLANDGFQLVLPWGSAKEKSRSERLTAAIPKAICPPQLNLIEAAALLGNAHAVIGVDTGLSHLAAALNVATIGIYTATDPGLTGLYAGDRAINLGGKHLSPSVDEVLQTLAQLHKHA